MYRGGLDRFKKAESLEPFSVSHSASSKVATEPSTSSLTSHDSNLKHQVLSHQHVGPARTAETTPQHITQVGGGQSTWQPPDWAIEPRPGVYYLEVVKDGEVLDQVSLEKKRHIFGRQFPMCDIVLDHQSVSRQHAAVVPHKNGSIYVIDLGSAHGTFVANERLTKEIPVELEVGQSLKFAASTRTYILRKNNSAFFPLRALPEEVRLPSPPDPSDEEAVLAYNTIFNRYGLSKPNISSNSGSESAASGTNDALLLERSVKRQKRTRVSFKDQVGGVLVEVVGVSDGADVDTEPGPLGVKEGSLVGKYESLVQVTVIPKGKEPVSLKEEGVSQNGVTDKLQEALSKVRGTPRTGGIYDDLFGDSFSGNVGSSWAHNRNVVSEDEQKKSNTIGEAQESTDVLIERTRVNPSYDNDDLFGDDDL